MFFFDLILEKLEEIKLDFVSLFYENLIDDIDKVYWNLYVLMLFLFKYICIKYICIWLN